MSLFPSFSCILPTYEVVGSHCTSGQCFVCKARIYFYKICSFPTYTPLYCWLANCITPPLGISGAWNFPKLSSPARVDGIFFPKYVRQVVAKDLRQLKQLLGGANSFFFKFSPLLGDMIRFLLIFLRWVESWNHHLDYLTHGIFEWFLFDVSTANCFAWITFSRTSPVGSAPENGRNDSTPTRQWPRLWVDRNSPWVSPICGCKIRHFLNFCQ